MDALQVGQVGLAMDTLKKARIDLARRTQHRELEDLDQEQFEALITYRSALVTRRLQLEVALKEAIEHLDREEKEVNNLVGEKMVNYARTALKGQKKKQIPTTAGVVQMRKLPDKLVILRKGKQLEWAKKSLPDAIRRSASLNSLSTPQLEMIQEMVEEGIFSIKQVLFEENVDLVKCKRHMKLTGELPGGMDLLYGQNRLYVKEGGHGQVVGSGEVDEDLLAVQTAEAVADEPDGAGKEDGPADVADSPPSLSPPGALAPEAS